MASTQGDALLTAAKNALDALERLSHGVQFGAIEQLRKAIQDSENEQRRAPVRLTVPAPPPCENRACPEQ
jgi:hypothetical protein